MEQHKITKGWRIWLRPNRIVPLLTLLVAGSAGILGVLGTIQMSVVDGIIISLLALLSVDALTERLSILEKIEDQLGKVSAGEQLLNRTQLLPARELARAATEIAFIGVSGISLLVNELGFLEQKMKEGCKLRFVLLDPKSSSLQSWNLLVKVTTSGKDIESALEYLTGLMRMEKVKGKCEVRLSKVYLPYSVLIGDPNKDIGSMNVEFYTYKTTLVDRPHIRLNRMQSRRWFDFYVTQFEQVWSDSEKWTPN